VDHRVPVVIFGRAARGQNCRCALTQHIAVNHDYMPRKSASFIGARVASGERYYRRRHGRRPPAKFATPADGDVCCNCCAASTIAAGMTRATQYRPLSQRIADEPLGSARH